MLKTKNWFRIHSFTGVITGMLLFIICWSGTFAVISYELDWLVNPALRVAPEEEKASFGEIMAAAEAAFPKAKLTSLHTSEYSTATFYAWLLLPDDTYRRAHVNPYSAEVMAVDTGYDIARFFRDLHMNFFSLGGSPFGSYLVMIFSLVLLVSLVSAMFVYKHWWTHFFEFRRLRRGKAFWTQLHKLSGVWSLWFLAVIAVTGGYYLYEQFQWDTGWLGPQKLDYVGDTTYAIVEIPEPEEDVARAELSLDSLIRITQQEWPDLEISSIFTQWPQEAGLSLHIRGHAGNLLSRALLRERANQIHIDKRSGEVLLKSGTSDLSVYWLISNAADPLHFGNFSGLVSKIIWFVFGLLLSGLILSGTYLHIKKLSQKNGWARHGWTATWWAVGITIIILLATIFYGFGSARWYGPVVEGIRQLPDLQIGIQLFLIAWILLTLAIIMAWVVMLWKVEKKQKGTNSNSKRHSSSGRKIKPTIRKNKVVL